MDKKCSKYEGLFVFSDDETLKKHINECEDCAAEYRKMQRVSELIGEVKSHYLVRNRKGKKLKIACAFLLFIFFGTFLGVVSLDSDYADSLIYGDSLSVEDLGFPVDSYGLLMVDE